MNQVELENQNFNTCINNALIRLDKMIDNKELSTHKGSMNIMPYYVADLTRLLKEYTLEGLAGKAKVKAVPVKVMTLIQPEIIAHYTVMTVVNSLGNIKTDIHSLCNRIARLLELEFDLLSLEKVNTEGYTRLVGFINSTSFKGARRIKLTEDLLSKYYKDVKKDTFKAWINVAQLAIHLLSTSKPKIDLHYAPSLLNIFTISEYRKGSRQLKSSKKLVPSKWFIKWIREQTKKGYLISTFNTPMIEKPLPWTNLKDGGFYTKPFKYKVVTTFRSIKLDSSTMKTSLDALNTLQETPWMINKNILNVINELYDNQETLGNLPKPMEITHLPYPFPNMDRKDMTKEQLAKVKEWSTFMNDEYITKVAETSKYMLLTRILNEAKRFNNFGKFYYAYKFDFRGRAYPVASNLQPQGNDYTKALLQFSEGKPIHTRQAEIFLAMQGANTYGEDKLRLSDKHQWVLDNHDKIISSANDPLNFTWWTTADEPFQFLAFCFEWMGYNDDPISFKSHLPIAMDGSCNGLQHLSAMLRDEVGGKQVNLTNNFDKQDIYQAVANKAIEYLKDEEELKLLADKILAFGITRSTTKRSVMIVPYAGTQRSSRDYIKKEMLERKGVEYFGEDFQTAVSLTNKYVWKAIGDIIIKGTEVMKWFKKNARVIIKHTGSKDIAWHTPNGFPVVQRRLISKPFEFETRLKDGIRLRTTMNVDTDEVDSNGHANAISPNFIHSLDACALQNTVNECKKKGIKNFAMIHDSYGTHASDSEQLGRILRQEFVNIYTQNNVLDNFINEQPQGIRELITETPSQGKLNLQEVLESEHFFS